MQPPVGQLEFTEKALEAKFSFSFTRKQLIVLVNVLRPMQFALNDLRGRVLGELLDEVEKTAIQSINESDYKKPENQTASTAEANSVNTN